MSKRFSVQTGVFDALRACKQFVTSIVEQKIGKDSGAD